MDIKNNILPFITGKEIKDFKDQILQDGDIVIADTAEDYIVGKACEIINSHNYNVVAGLHTIVCRPKQKMAFGYLGYYINSNVYRKQLIPLMQGIKVLSLNKMNIKNTIISYPDSLQEQTKIATFLYLLDKNIKQQELKLILLNKYKRGLLSYVFDRIYEFPNIPLKNICSITTGKLDANAMTTNGKYKFFTCAKQDYLTDTFAFDGDAILISGNGNVGYSKFYSGKFNAYQRTYVLMNFKGNPIYIKYAIDIKLKDKIKEEINLGAMPFIKLKTLSELKIILPPIKVQEKTAKILSTFDELIEKENNILSLLKHYKQGLLQQMFI